MPREENGGREEKVLEKGMAVVACLSERRTSWQVRIE